MEESNRPWGKYTVIKDESNFKLKIIEVNPGQRLSYQYHNKRSEVWTIVEGSGEVVIDGKKNSLKYGDCIKIDKKSDNMKSDTYEKEKSKCFDFKIEISFAPNKRFTSVPSC